MTLLRAPLVSPPALALAAALLAAPAAAQGPEAPRARTLPPTTAAISPEELRARVHLLADDSLAGRRAGERGNFVATEYVARELRRMGLEPAGEDGGFFQTVPLYERRLDPASSLVVDGAALALGADFLPLPREGAALPFGMALVARDLPTVYGGRLGGELIDAAAARGRLVVLAPPLGPDGRPSYRFWTTRELGRFSGAAAVAVVALEEMPPELVEYFGQPGGGLRGAAPAPAGPVGMLVTAAAAGRLLGAPPAGLRPGAAGRAVSGAVRFVDAAPPHPARNVVAVLRGRDPALRGEYVAISAHNDHVGTAPAGVDHDSVRVFNRLFRPEGGNGEAPELTPVDALRLRSALDSVRALRPVRRDSVFNGADDDASGTAALLEIAEALAAAPERPRRSVLFVSHTAEEAGLYGSQHFSDHPTVPRDAIVALLNMDMVGRGRAEDVAGGGPFSLQVIGSRRLSTELGTLIEEVNARRAEPMRFDYTFDAPGHPYNRYCRSDHFMYARHGIPISYFSLGYHVDYHQVSDEAQYLDYDHMARVGSLLHDVVRALADRDRRPAVDGPRQDPDAPCRQ